MRDPRAWDGACMDARDFDRLARSLVERGTRRGLLGLLTGLPLLGGLAAFLTAQDETAAKNRRKKRKKPHKRAKRRRKQNHKKRHCKAHARSKICNGKCGKITNNCGKKINCGSCDCNPACGTCQSCEGAPGVCVQDAPGTPCGETGQVCQDDGTCTCTDSSCPSCLECGGDGTCAGGQCVGGPGCCTGILSVATCPACTA